MSVVINIILILASLVLIVAVLMQEGSKQGLGSIGGMAETFLGKNEAKSAEGKLLNITRIVAAIFVVLALVATWLNARTYTVTYYDENGNEYFTEIANEVMSNNLMVAMGQEGTNVTYDEVYEAYKAQAEAADMTMDELAKNMRASYKKGENIPQYPTPSKEGYNGIWVLGEKTEDGVKKIEGDVPATMGRKGITLIPEYTIGTYTLKVVDNGMPVEGEETAEDNVIFEVTGEYGTEIDYSSLAALPEVQEYYVFYSTSKDAQSTGAIYNVALPETIPGYDATLYVNYAHGNFVEYYVTNDEGEEKELYPAFQESIFQQVAALWEQTNPMTEDTDVEAYMNNYIAAMEPDGEITTAAAEMYNAYVTAYGEADMLDYMRQFVAFGEEFSPIDAPVKEGFESKWDIEVPEVGDGVRYQLHAVFTPVEEAAEEVTEEVPTEEVTEEAPSTEAE